MKQLAETVILQSAKAFQGGQIGVSEAERTEDELGNL